MENVQNNSFFSKCAHWYHIYILPRVAIIVSMAVALSCLTFFCLILFPQIFDNYQITSYKGFGLAMFLISVLWTLIGVFMLKPEPIHALAMGLESTILSFASFAYILRLQSSGLTFGNYNIQTNLLFIPLTLFIFAVNYNIFGPQKRQLGLILGQIFLFLLLSLGLISYLQEDRTILRSLSQNWLVSVFEQSAYMWLAGCAVAVSVVSVLTYRLEKAHEFLLYWIALFTIAFSLLLFLFGIGQMSYWYQALIFIVIWDFLLEALNVVVKDIKDPKFRPRLWISYGYHMALLICVIAAFYLNI
jgi:hypothetical protein